MWNRGQGHGGDTEKRIDTKRCCLRVVHDFLNLEIRHDTDVDANVFCKQNNLMDIGDFFQWQGKKNFVDDIF